MEESAQQVIDRLRKGERVKRAAESFFSPAGAIDPAALALLGDAIRTAPEPTRENLVRLLVAVGRKADPLRSAGGNLVRDLQVIALLVSPSLEVKGGGRDHALDVLEASVPPALLSPHGEALAKDLKERNGSGALYVVAKAKAMHAKATVDAIYAADPGQSAAAIARAALGDAAVEKSFVETFLATRDPAEKIRLSAVLGRIGTKGALSALASEMRTDLVEEVPSVMKRSVRLDILAALSRSFPDNPILWDNAINGDEDYARVEAFCEATFGTKWKKPRPPFLTVQGYPSHPPD